MKVKLRYRRDAQLGVICEVYDEYGGYICLACSEFADKAKEEALKLLREKSHYYKEEEVEINNQPIQGESNG